ncbi:hypothetical protein GCM10025864_40620 [Luteimicrobium album]|uniref:Uncharacterized protein n=1 Tax=Luteimicrobium album TaxID=1054550 RepID=A0ABQ6I8K9_9MICO|nr:hypothetical protein GCM10025864_40620 [Luteimicrobium album]
MLASSRTAVTRCEIGFTWTKPCSQPGIDFGSTYALDRNVSGNRMIIEIPCTLEAVRAITPKNAKIQLTAQEHAITRRPASTTERRPPAGR